MATKKGVATVYGTGQMFGNGGTTSNTVEWTKEAALRDAALRAQRKLSNPTTSAVQPVQIPSTGGTPISTEYANAVLQESVSTAPPINTANTATQATSSNPYENLRAETEQRINDNATARIAAEEDAYNRAVETTNKQYDDWLKGTNELYEGYRKQAQEQQARNEAATKANYDNTARQNYILYRQAQKQLPSQLNALGIRGGAAESSLIRLGSNYGTNVANNEMARAQALDGIAQQYAEAISNLDMEQRRAILNRDDAKAQQLAELLNNYMNKKADIEASRDDALLNAYLTSSENAITWDEQQKEKEEAAKRQAIEDKRYKDETKYEREKYAQEYEDAQKAKMVEQYAAGLAKYTSIDTLEKMAENIKKDKNWSKDPTKYGKVQAINARIGEIKAANKK